MSLPPVLRAARVQRDPAETFRLFTDAIGAWWPLRTHGLFGEDAGGVSFVDGRLVERSVTGEEVVWAEAVHWEPPHRLVLRWHAGREQGTAGRVEVTFRPDGDGTRVELVHDGWEAFGELARQVRRGYRGPTAWGFVLDHFTDLADLDPEPDGPNDDSRAGDLAILGRAYEAFFAEASAGSFSAPPPGEWTAEQVVAHIAVNDDLLARVCRVLIHQGSPSLDNAIPNDRAVLDRLARRTGGLSELIELGRRRARVVQMLLGRLDAEQLDQLVPCHLIDGTEVVLDSSIPWQALAIGAQASYHLPLHTRQLAALRQGAQEPVAVSDVPAEA